MAVIHDMIPAFELFQPASLDDAIGLLDKYGNDAMVLAGGLDSMDWLKDRIRRPRYVVDLGAIEGLRGIKAAGDGVEIGAMTTLTEVVRSPLLKEKFGLLMEGAEKAASPQIRNQGTLGGNVNLDTRCRYVNQSEFWRGAIGGDWCTVPMRPRSARRVPADRPQGASPSTRSG